MPAKPDRRQVAIDLENPAGQQRRQSRRTEQRRTIERLKIPRPTSGHRPSSASCKAVLLALDEATAGREGWRIKQATLAAKCGFKSRHTIRRALSWLIELGWVHTVRTGRSSLYALDRQTIAAAAAEPPDGQHQMGAPVTSDERAGNIRWARRQHQMGAPATSDGRAGNIYTTYHSKSISTTTSQQWTAVAETLEQVGVYPATRSRLVAELPRCGVAPADALAAIDHWQSAGQGGTDHAAWQIGALVDRLRHLEPGADPAAGWPPPAAEFVRQQRQQAAAREQRQRTVQEAHQRRQQDAERRDLAELEERWGRRLDAYSDSDRDRLAAELFAGNAVAMRRYRRTWPKAGSWCRVELLRAIAAGTRSREIKGTRSTQ